MRAPSRLSPELSVSKISLLSLLLVFFLNPHFLIRASNCRLLPRYQLHLCKKIGISRLRRTEPMFTTKDPRNFLKSLILINIEPLHSRLESLPFIRRQLSSVFRCHVWIGGDCRRQLHREGLDFELRRRCGRAGRFAGHHGRDHIMPQRSALELPYCERRVALWEEDGRFRRCRS